MDKHGLGIACVTGAVLFAFALQQRGYITIPKDKVDGVQEKRAKEIRLSYDEMLKHNIDSLVNEGMPTRKAIKDAHTITWEEAERSMPKKVKDYNGEDWVKLEEAQNQLEASRKVVFGRIVITSYKEDYPEKLENQIQERKKELQEMNDQQQTNDKTYYLAQKMGYER